MYAGTSVTKYHDDFRKLGNNATEVEQAHRNGIDDFITCIQSCPSATGTVFEYAFKHPRDPKKHHVAAVTHTDGHILLKKHGMSDATVDYLFDAVRRAGLVPQDSVSMKYFARYVR